MSDLIHKYLDHIIIYKKCCFDNVQKSVKTIEMNSRFFHKSTNLTEDYINNIPNHIETLLLTNFYNVDIPLDFLPESLIRLDIENNGCAHNNLPRNLKILNLNGFNNFMLPQNLELLSISYYAEKFVIPKKVKYFFANVYFKLENLDFSQNDSLEFFAFSSTEKITDGEEYNSFSLNGKKFEIVRWLNTSTIQVNIVFMTEELKDLFYSCKKSYHFNRSKNMFENDVGFFKEVLMKKILENQ